MTIDEIIAAKSDDDLLNLISRELESRLPPRQPIDEFLIALKKLPPGLRAMASTYDLDVSLALDDLGWHFGNWHHVGLAHETICGLRELGADDMAINFARALELAQAYWSELGSQNWTEWYNDSPLNTDVAPLSNDAYEIWESQPMGLLSFWLRYARRHPEKLIDD